MADDAFPLPGVTSIATITDWENFFHPGTGTGVVPGVLSELLPTLDTTGRNAVVAPGGAFVRAFYKPVSASTPTPIPAAAAQDRIDRLVLRLDRSQTAAANFVVPTVLTGTPAASPQPPALTQTDTGIWDMPLARWTSAASGALTGLVDERVFLTSPLIAATSKATPTLQRPSLLIETDTGRLRMSTRAGTWDAVIYEPDDGWHKATTANGWGGNQYYRRLRDGSVELAGSASGSSPNSSPVIFTLPADGGYRPANGEPYAPVLQTSGTYTDPGLLARNNGQVTFVHTGGSGSVDIRLDGARLAVTRP